MTQTDHFRKGIAFAKWLTFKMVSFLEYLFFFFERFFAHNYFNVLVESISACFSEFYFLTQIDHFGKAIAFAKLLIFKMVSFLEYLCFFRAVFCAQLLFMC